MNSDTNNTPAGTILVLGGTGKTGRRIAAQLDAQGAASFPLDLSQETPGDTAWFQVWFRDPLDPTGFGVGLSNGLEVTWCE